MNFTLEALDQVIETTGVTYAEAKEALTQAGGDADAAISAIREAAVTREAEPFTEEDQALETEAKEDTEAEDLFEESEGGDTSDSTPLEDLMEKVSDLIKSGNVRKVVVKRDGEEVLSVPLNLGLLGGIVGVAAAPTAVILAAIAAYGLDCTIEVEKQDGTTENVE